MTRRAASGHRVTLTRGGLLAAGAALVLAAAGCGTGEDSTTNAAASGKASTAEGGTLRWAINANASWDPVTSAAGNEVRHLGLVYAALTSIDEQGRPQPGLATKWAFSKKGTVLTFTLRPGVTFTDGAKLDAEAVKTNLDRAQQQKGSVLTQLLANVKKTKVVDASTVELDLSQADYGLPLVLGGKAGMQVSPKAIAAGVQNLPTKPVGAGPFRLTKFVPDASSTLVRNPGYWDAKEIHLDGVDLQYLNDPQAVLAGLQSGSIDLASSTGSQVAASKRAGLQVEQLPSLSAASIEINDAIKPFDNKKLTEAINYAIDRKALIRTQNGGIGEPSYQPFPKGYVGYSPEVADLYPYDPDKAKQLVKEAGFPNGVTIPITYFDAQGYKGLTEQLQAQLAAVGIKSKLSTLPLAQAAERVYVKHDVAFNPNGIVGRESPLQMLDVQYGKDGLLNPGRKASPELTTAIADAAKLPLDDPKYPAAIQAVTARAAKESAVAFLYTTPTVLVHTSKVSGIRPYIVGTRLEGVRLGG
ncbi:ABC transporter substrate-binding protein [Patulibacter minatonensis]|uniref:ABC transporter substrate-binding protein n=1 Tax=Patulibacter minatonensis TaxID=298163 RepID=UPI00047895E5|nr:ABC transporter substrate-binding protein [Patulibacter minatonensis]